MKTVLVIDDDLYLQKLLGTHIASAGYNLLYASDGEKAMEILKSEQPDLITLDMMMPILDGISFLKWLRQEAASEIPVMVLTGVSNIEQSQQLQQLGANDVATKPIAPDELLKRINNLLNKEQNA
ncbi:MAG: response regulator [Pseudomonadota bacterium]